MKPSRNTWRAAMVFLTLSAIVYAATCFLLPRRARENEVWVSEEITLAALDMYAVSLGRAETPEEARLMAARYTNRGAAACVDGTLVLGAGYDDRERAESAAARLLQEEALSCEVAVYSASPVRMRFTARPGQISAFTDLERALREGASSLNELSFSLDRGEAGVSQARQAASAVYERIYLALAEFDRQELSSAGEAADGLRTLAREFLVNLEAVLNEKSQTALAFSGKLKYNYLNVRIAQIYFLQSMNGKG